MKHLLKSLFCLAVLTAGLATQAQAQIVTYDFTGTLIPGTGTAGIGNTIAGSLTLDVAAAPDNFANYGCGEYAQWFNGGFSIDGITNTGIAAGTSFGLPTEFYVRDLPCDRSNTTVIYSNGSDATHSRVITFYSISDAATGDGEADVPNPWQPFAEQFQGIFIHDRIQATDVSEYGRFNLKTFTVRPPTIIIDGFDTGIPDFVYNGKLVSQQLADCAAVAKNHGAYVSCVTKLTNALKKAGLLTDTQKAVIMRFAAQSSIGKGD